MNNEVSEKRQSRIKEWFSRPENRMLVLILVFAFAVRLYYFFITKSQPLWWDETEYMLKAKHMVLGTPDSGWYIGRPPLLPYILSLFVILGIGEAPIHFFMILISLGIILLIYLLGKELFNEKIALLGAFLYSLIYLDLFYTSRILPNVPELFFGLLAFYLFYMSYVKDRKYLIPFLIVAIIGVLTRFTAALYVIIIALFVSLMKDIRPILRDKKFMKVIYVLIGIAIIGAAVAFFAKLGIVNGLIDALNGALFRRVESRSSVFWSFILTVPNTIHYLTIMFAIGFTTYFYSYALMIDKIIAKKGDMFSAKKSFAFLWLVVPFLVYGLVIDHYEDRYIMIAFPIVCLLAAQGIFSIYDLIKKYSKVAAIIVFIVILAFGSYQLINHSDLIIKNKADTYNNLKSAGLWLKENSPPNTAIFSTGVPQNTYYSERATYPYPENESDFINSVRNLSASYMIISIWEQSPEWVYGWPQNNPTKAIPVQAYYVDSTGNNLGAVIYQFNRSAIG